MTALARADQGDMFGVQAGKTDAVRQVSVRCVRNTLMIVISGKDY